MSKSDDNSKIFDNRELMLKVWQNMGDRAYSRLEFVLETARFYFLLISALLAIYAVVIGIEVQPSQLLWKAISLIPVSSFIIFFAATGLLTLIRQYRRYLEHVAYLGKIEEIIGLSEPKKTRTFEKDNFLFNRFIESRTCPEYDSSEAFIKGESKKRDTLCWDLKLVYLGFMLVGVILMIVALVLVVISNNRVNDPRLGQLALQLQSLHTG